MSTSRVQAVSTVKISKIRRQSEPTEKVTFNDIIKMMALIHQEVDRKLSEMVNICVSGK